MINIAGRLFVTIKVDGNDLPHSPNLVERITMTEGMGALSPAIELILHDQAGSLTKGLALTDGNELLITVGKTPNDVNTQSRQFRVFGIRQMPTASGPRMQVIGIYDAPGFLTGSVRESFKGTTGDVLRLVAEKCKLEYHGPEEFNGRKTDDNQVWMNIAKSRAMFVQQTTRHGYMDQHSVMFAVLTSLGHLRYLNLNDVIETPQEKIKRMFVHNTYEDAEKQGIITYTVAQAKTRSSAGLMNTWQNYGSTRIEHKLDGEQASHDKVEVKTSANYLAINDTVKRTVERSRIEYSPLDCGNTHKNFNKALYQNVKMLGLFTEHVSVLTFDVTDLQPLDMVMYRQADADPKVAVSNSDIYMVIGKTIVVKSGHYAERIELVRHNITEKGAAELATATNQTADSVIPNSVIDPTSHIGATSLPNAQSLGALTLPTQASMNRMTGSLPDMRRAAGFAVPNLKGISSCLRAAQKGILPAAQLVGNLRASINSLKHYADLGQQFSDQMKYSAQNLKVLGDSMRAKNLSSSLCSTLLYQKNGIMNSYAQGIGGVKQQMQMGSTVYPISLGLDRHMSEIEKIAGGRQAVEQFQEQANRITGIANSSRRSCASIWNESLSCLSGTRVPPNSSMNYSNGSKTTDVFTGLYRAPSSGSSITVPVSTTTDDLTNSMFAKNRDRQPSWIPVDAVWDHDASVDVSRRAYNEMYASSLPKIGFQDSVWSPSNFSAGGETFLPQVRTSFPTYTCSVDSAEHSLSGMESEFEKAESRENSDKSDW